MGMMRGKRDRGTLGLHQEASLQGMETGWEEGLLQAGCSRTKKGIWRDWDESLLL